jgi:hypothetical protein
MRVSNRKTNFREVKKPILIVCEDSKSSVFYFKAKIKDLNLNPVDVEVDGNSNSSPDSVVKYAVKRKNAQKKKAQKEGIEEYEFIYCVMDVDDHPTLKNAIQQAIDNNIIPIVSNQSFEIWYLLHFMEYSTAYIHRNDIVKKLKIYLGKEYEKSDNKIYELLKSKGSEEKAIENAKKLIQSAENDSDERNPLRNSSTNVYVLIEKLKDLTSSQLSLNQK